jgi:pimeloyl-ACP methyl ester carboxylesterase
LFVPLAARIFGRPRVRYTYATSALGPEARAQLSKAPGWSLRTLEVEPGVTLQGLVRKPANANAPWLFFVSGNDGTLLQTAQRFVERVRNGADFGAAVYAYRGYDSSTGTPYRDDIAEDVRASYQALLSAEHVAPKRVHVVAFSLGAYFAARLVGELTEPERPASLSLLAPAEFIVMARRSWAQRFSPGDLIEMQPLLPALPAPVLVIQGDADKTTGVEQGRVVAERLGARARYLERPGIGHLDLQEDAEAAAAVHALMLSPPAR